ncbi:hypothetical protein H4R24_000073 [Coemansia sp. RSA 988]|nr:hypothetical protein H4R24_000073 [Coemansia sp. RSA 988]
MESVADISDTKVNAQEEPDDEHYSDAEELRLGEEVLSNRMAYFANAAPDEIAEVPTAGVDLEETSSAESDRL